MKHPWSGLKNIPRNIWLLSTASLINRMGMMVLPFIVLYAVEELNASPSEAGIVLAVYGIGSLITSPFAGKLSDKLGAVKLMEISLILTGVFLFAYSMVTDLYLFILLSFIFAVISEAFRPASMSFISNNIESERRKTAFALHRLAINLGMSIGPVLGGILSQINFSLLFYFDGTTSLMAGFFLIAIRLKSQRVLPEPEAIDGEAVKEGNTISPFRNKKFIYFMLALIPVLIIFFQHIGALPLFFVEEIGLSKSTFGFLMATNTVLIILIEVPLNDSMRLWKAWKALTLGSFLAALGFGMMAFITQTPFLVLSIIIWTFGEMIVFPTAGDYVAQVSPENRRGEYMGYFQMAFSFSFMVGPLVGNRVFENFGSFSLWIGCFVLGLISALMMIRLKKDTFIKN
ncbi:MAG: MFS transporter [Ignavibacteriaceae bacterium]